MYGSKSQVEHLLQLTSFLGNKNYLSMRISHLTTCCWLFHTVMESHWTGALTSECTHLNARRKKKKFISIIFTISLIGCWEEGTVQLHLIGKATRCLWCLLRDYHCNQLAHNHPPHLYPRLCDQNIWGGKYSDNMVITDYLPFFNGSQGYPKCIHCPIAHYHCW